MTSLFMRNVLTGDTWRVWPDPESVMPGVVQETGSYLFELRGGGEASEADLLIDDIPLEALRTREADVARWRWTPGFHAGTVEAELRLPNLGPRRFEIVTDPDKRKLSRDEFDSMVREILEDTFALFSLTSFKISVARGSGVRPPAIARLEFLRSRIDELEDIVAGIARSPRKLLASQETVLPYYRATRATGPEILRSFRTGRIVKETGHLSRLPAPLGGFLPERIRVRQRRNSLDLEEHRQMASCLRAWASWLSAAAEQLERSKLADDTEARQGAAAWAARCRRLVGRVGRLATASPFAQVGAAPPRLVLSAIFRNDPAYRRFYRLWQDMNLGVAGIYGEFLNLPLARTFDLYELWCFLRLLRAAADEFGVAELDIQELFLTDASGGVTIAAGTVSVPIGAGWKICFQKQYREFWVESDGHGSYSRTMTPDVVATRHDPVAGTADRLIVLDAKYRIDKGLNDALSSIHTYRDALVRETVSGQIEGVVSAAYLLTPYLPASTPTDDYRATAMPGRLFRPDYQTAFCFGAVTLKPGMSSTQILVVLRRILADASAGTDKAP